MPIAFNQSAADSQGRREETQSDGREHQTDAALKPHRGVPHHTEHSSFSLTHLPMGGKHQPSGQKGPAGKPTTAADVQYILIFMTALIAPLKALPRPGGEYLHKTSLWIEKKNTPESLETIRHRRRRRKRKKRRSTEREKKTPPE